MLRHGLVHHRAGRVTEAEQIYRKILKVDARQADCLHLLGMIAYQERRYEAAVELIRQAIASKPTDAVYHSNLGTVFQAQGKMEEAAACYERALIFGPEIAETHYNLGSVFHAQEKLEAAVGCYQRALALRPDLVPAHYNLGNVLQAQAKPDEAASCYERALALEPGKVEAHHNLGNALQAQDKLDEAVACFRRLLALDPGYVKGHYSLGCALQALGKIDEALAKYKMARAIEPAFAQAGFSESLAQLSQGNFASGWRNFEWRWQTKDHDTPMRPYAQPLWSGEKLASGNLLIWGEQGIGDEVMFAGLIPEVIRTGNHCLLDCDPRLKAVFARSFPGVEVVSSRDPGRESTDDVQLDFAAHLPSGSLPGLFRPARAAFAATKSPYLLADPAQRQQFRARYSQADGQKLVGLAWYTNNRKTGRQRSIALPALSPLFKVPGIQWVSLQYGNHDALENEAAAGSVPILIDSSVDQFVDIDRFASQIAAMDLVLTIDNSTAHLAGALGVRTWVLLPFACDWRWLQQREDSPWYPSVRLFRQLQRGDWESVVKRVRSELGVAMADGFSVSTHAAVSD